MNTPYIMNIHKVLTIFFYLSISCVISLFCFPLSVFAMYDPLSVPNNTFGIHVADPNNIPETGALLNSSGGDWGYVTLVIQDDDRNTDKWQGIFDTMRREHLIPIVRLATHPENGYWSIPNQDSFKEWVQFLNSLNWVIENRYVVLFNEPNHKEEWGNILDPEGYAETLVRFGSMLHDASPDYFVLPAGLDVSASSNGSDMDAEEYLRRMVHSKPEVLQIINGWTSHAYPNPNFSGSPYRDGRGTLKSYIWELDVLDRLGNTTTYPVFITETGWKHETGKNTISSYRSEKEVSQFIEYAAQNIWNDPRIAAVTPFVYSYLDVPFDHFSWKKLNNNEYYDQYFVYQSVPKIKGAPKQHTVVSLDLPLIPDSFVAGSSYSIQSNLNNTGQSIISSDNNFSLLVEDKSGEFSLLPAPLPVIEPKREGKILVHLNTPRAPGQYFLSVFLVHGNEKIPLQQTLITIVPPPKISLEIKIGWRARHSLDGLTILIYNKYDELIHKFTNVHIEDRHATIAELYDVIPEEQYRIVAVYPYHLPRQTIAVLHATDTLVQIPRMLPIDFSNDGKLSIDDLYAMLKMSPYEVFFTFFRL